MPKIKVLVVDDSALIRQILTRIFTESPDIEVVGTANDPYIARDKIKALNPDVLTLDVEMPRMDGLTFLRNLMRLRPMPVVMISSLTEQGADVTLKALEIGAVDFVTKPKADILHGMQDYAEDIISKVRMAARVNVQVLEGFGSSTVEMMVSTDIPRVRTHFKTTDKIIAVGSSTGGTEALKVMVRNLPLSTPPIVVTQHLPLAFSDSFAKHVNNAGPMSACVAEDGQQIYPGNIYIAPGDSHLQIVRDGARYVCRLSNTEPVNRHRPSVEVMFRSIAENVGCNAIGVMLTGMGADGAFAMKQMRDAGAVNIVQDEQSSVVWGMPGEACRLGAANFVLPLDKIAAHIKMLISQEIVRE